MIRHTSSEAVKDVSRESGTLFRRLWESAADALMVVNPQGNIVLVNAHGETLFGYQRDELLGQPLETLLPERSRGRQFGRQGFFQESGGRLVEASWELHGLQKDGAEVPIEISLSPLETDEGTLV